MVHKENAEGFEGYLKSLESLYKDKNTKLYIFFLGQQDDAGKSWCCDCNDAQPFIDQAVANFAGADDIFLTVDVGNRSYWKDAHNPFRKDSNIKLTGIPTLIRWKSSSRLEGDQCTKIDLLEKFFSGN